MDRYVVLVTGGSCTGKSAVAAELRRRGASVIDGDRDIAYQGDPLTGKRLASSPAGRPSHWNHIWDVEAARELVATAAPGCVYLCGDARNLNDLVPFVDAVVVLQIDVRTLRRRLDARPIDEFGATPDERELVLRLHDRPGRWPDCAVHVDATRTVDAVVDDLDALVARFTDDGGVEGGNPHR
ncbi:nucleoside kinase [Williamsia sp. SKLECPSW1]